MLRPPGSMRALALATLVSVLPAAARGQAPTGSADVTIEETRPGVFSVEGRYRVDPAPPTLVLRALGRACSELRDVRVERDGAALVGSIERDGPWLVFRPTDVAAFAPLDLTVRYEVETSGTDSSIPVFVPAAPIPQRDGEREGAVRVEVRLAGADGAVTFPHMSRGAGSTWAGRYAAVPSFVQIRSAGGGSPCPEAPVDADDGGLSWRFFLLLGIMVAWVPIYQLWARRSTGEEAS